MGDVPATSLGMGELMASIQNLSNIEVGAEAKKHFLIDPDYRNLNHGAFGTYPKEIRDVLRHHQDLSEARPCVYQLSTQPQLLREQRAVLAKYVNVPVTDCVFVMNATTGVNTVLRNLVFQPGDTIIYFATIYGSCEKTIRYITETTPAESRKIEYTYPVSDDFLCTSFEDTVSDLRKAGKNPKICIFDTVVSSPGVRMPFEQLTKLCRKHEVLSLIDGAHCVGQIPLDLGALDPDFMVSNCHKWLYTPRGSAMFYVPERNQALMRSTLPTGHGFKPIPVSGEEGIKNPLMANAETHFENNFSFVSTLDINTYLCVSAAIEFRKKIRWGELQGEEAIFKYLNHLARRAAEIVPEILGPESVVLENEERSLGRCAFAMVKLPLHYETVTGGDYELGYKCWEWMKKALMYDYKTYIPPIFYGNSWWVRISAQIYLDEEDLVWAGETLKKLCERVKNGEWKD